MIEQVASALAGKMEGLAEKISTMEKKESVDKLFGKKDGGEFSKNPPFEKDPIKEKLPPLDGKPIKPYNGKPIEAFKEKPIEPITKNLSPEWRGVSDNKASNLEKQSNEVKANDSSKTPETKDDEIEKKEPIKNKVEGLRREKEVEEELREKYPEEEGYSIESETYLRDKDGKIVKDPETGEARRIDFVVVKDGKVVDSIEVTSKTADKTDQMAKENRIKENGGNYIKDSDGNLVEIPKDVNTRIDRRD